MLAKLRHILEMIRFSHTLFALPFAILAAVMAWRYRAGVLVEGSWRWREVVGILVCIVCARSAAMAFNRIADRQVDADNPRTAGRHLPSGVLSTGSVARFTVAMAVGFVAGTLLFLPNRWPLYLSLPVLAFIGSYSFTKRFTWLSHFWLGAALMLAPVATWIALVGPQALATPLVLGSAVLMWVAGFDVIYACQDLDFDRRADLKSVPARFGLTTALRIAALCHAVMVVLLAALPWCYPELGWIYAVGIAAVAMLLAYEHWLVRPSDLTRVNVAFFQVNAVVSVGLLVITAVDLLSG